MKIELMGSIDYKKLAEYLDEKIEEITNNNFIGNPEVEKIINVLIKLKSQLIEEIKQLEKDGRANIVATAGRLSRYPGTVFEILEIVQEKNLEKNTNFIKKVINMGHDSILELDHCVFAIESVSPIVEQTIIEERFASFTIKSRREVDFSKVGFYTPDFRDENGTLLSNNEQIKKEYQNYMKTLFDSYSYFVENDINKEDARFVLPYCYHSNIIMGINARTLKDMIIKFTKTKYSKIQELKELGEKLYNIAKENIPSIIDEIDKVPYEPIDKIESYLNKVEKNEKKYKILEKPQLITCTNNIDETILISAIMRRYQYDYETAQKLYKKLIQNKLIASELMKKIAFEGDSREFAQVSFQFQIPLSLAVLTHFTRHRTHPIMVPDFCPNFDLEQFKIPPKINANEELNQVYKKIYELNKKMYDKFKNDYHVSEEDLIYFTLSGNMVNVVSNLDGKTLKHILRLRECNKAQWETRQMAIQMHKEIDKLETAKIYSTTLGATCTTQGYCKEGKESCGKIKTIKK